MAFLRRKVPQLSGKDDQSGMRSASLQPLPIDTIQTILKCISASSNTVSTELTQEIIQMNFQARMLLEKPAQNMLSTQAQPGQQPAAAGQAQAALNAQQQQQQPLKPLIQNQGTIDMIQTMMNLNIQNSQQANSLSNFANSPNKILLSQLSNNGINFSSNFSL